MDMRFAWILLVFGLSSCQLYQVVCPRPDPVRQHRAYANHMRRERMKVWAKADDIHHTDYDFSKRHVDVKDTADMETWDCPRPGSRQDKRNEARRIREWKKYAAALKKQIDKGAKDQDPQGSAMADYQ